MSTLINKISQVVKENLRIDLFDIESEQEFKYDMDLEHGLKLTILFGWHLSSIDFYISDADNLSESYYPLRVWSEFSFPERDTDEYDQYRSVEGARHTINSDTRNEVIPYFRYTDNGDITPVIKALDRRDYLSQLERELVLFVSGFKDEHLKKHVERWNANEELSKKFMNKVNSEMLKAANKKSSEDLDDILSGN